MNETNRGVFVLGNGADLFCGLKSSIDDFYNFYKDSPKYKELLSYAAYCSGFKHNGYLTNSFPVMAAPLLDKDFSLIEVMLLLLDPNGELRYWNQVESILQKSLISEIDFNWKVVLKHILNCCSSHPDQVLLSRNRNNSDTNFKEMVAASAIIRFNNGYNDINEDLFYEFLNKELIKFESKFKEYLSNQIKQDFKYNDKVNSLVKIFNNYGINFIFTKIISFNYTKPIFQFNSGDICNIHGNLTDKCIIGINVNEDYPNVDIFTKTFRKWTQCKEINMDYKYEHVYNLYFFGHSFNEQDYSLYFSLFDRIKAFNNNPKFNMTLFYSKGANDKRDPNEIKNQLLISLLKMIKDYCIKRDNLILFDNIVNKGITVKYINSANLMII